MNLEGTQIGSEKDNDTLVYAIGKSAESIFEKCF